MNNTVLLIGLGIVAYLVLSSRTSSGMGVLNTAGKTPTTQEHIQDETGSWIIQNYSDGSWSKVAA